MAHIRPSRGRPSPSRADEKRWADLADLVLIIAREIQFQGYRDEDAVRLSQSEGMVMRFLLANTEATPSRIATATGLQRSNLSTVLRGLEEKRLIERHDSPEDARGVSVHVTERGVQNYRTVRQEWAATVWDAAGGDTTYLDAALELLAGIEAGMTRHRRLPGATGSKEQGSARL